MRERLAQLYDYHGYSDSVQVRAGYDVRRLRNAAFLLGLWDILACIDDVLDEETVYVA